MSLSSNVLSCIHNYSGMLVAYEPQVGCTCWLMFLRLNLLLTVGQARTPETFCRGHIIDKIILQGYQSLKLSLSWCLSCSFSFFKYLNS